MPAQNEGHNTAGTEPFEDLAADALSQLGVETPAARRAKRIIPWLGSLALHVGLILVGLVVTWTVVSLRSDDEVVIVEVDFFDPSYQPVSALAATDLVESAQAVQDRVDLEVAVDPLDMAAQWDLSPINQIAETGGAGALSAFAPQTSGSGAMFVGLRSSNAQRIVYVIDASGSMIAAFQFIIQELAKSLDALNPSQQFHIIFFQANDALIVPPKNRLLDATEEEITRALAWIDANVIPRGRSNPLKAIEAAIDLNPDAIFLLSENITGSGQFEIDQADLLAMLDALNPRNPRTNQRAVQINCIQFLDPDPLDTLRRIAEAHGGDNGYKFLSRAELGLATP
jgi:hypothetical protein